MKVPTGTSSSFSRRHEQIFLRREYAAIRGERGQVFILLLALVFATLLAVVLARSGMIHLRQRMADPLTSLISINANNARYLKNYARIQAFLDSCAQTGAFHAYHASGDFTDGWFFHAKDEPRPLYATVISFGFWNDQELLKRILHKDNLLDGLHGKAMLGDPSVFRNGVIISQEFMEVLGCTPRELRDKMILMVHGNRTVPLRVLAVVRTLPEKSRCLVEQTLLMDLRDPVERNIFPYGEQSALRVWITNAGQGPINMAELQNSLSEELGDPVTISVEQNDELATHQQLLSIVRNNGRKWDTRMEAYWQERFSAQRSSIHALHPAVKFNTRLMHPDSVRVFGRGTSSYLRYDQLTIIFRKVDMIGAFQDALREHTAVDGNPPVELDLDRVESQKNFGTVAALGSFLLIFLVAFAILSIILYLYNLLRNHLERMKMNLGTFMAFGLSPVTVKAGYLRIILYLLARVFLVAFLSLLVIELALWAVQTAGFKVPPVLGQVSVLTNPWLYLCVAGIMGLSLWICNRQLSRFLALPPGDLIYDRK